MFSVRVINPVSRPVVCTKPMRAVCTKPLRVVRTKLSPIATDMMTSFGVHSAGTSAMLFVFLIGRVIIDAAEQSVIAEKKANKSNDTSGYDPDSDSDE
jgi:hypothetical protein